MCRSPLLTSLPAFRIVTFYYYYFFYQLNFCKGNLAIITIIFNVTFLGECGKNISNYVMHGVAPGFRIYTNYINGYSLVERKDTHLD